VRRSKKLFGLFILCGAFHVLVAQEDTLLWEEDRPLLWSDFKASPNPAAEAVAITASGLTFAYSISESERGVSSFKAEVSAHFYPDRSWVQMEQATDHVLVHERLHFDITELYARKLRKALSSLTVNRQIAAQLKQTHDRINGELDRMQNAYDFETNHSINIAAQERWEQKVRQELEALQAYSNTRISVKR
jgi:hypothetical protein